jgi:hypothetical protein
MERKVGLLVGDVFSIDLSCSTVRSSILSSQQLSANLPLWPLILLIAIYSYARNFLLSLGTFRRAITHCVLTDRTAVLEVNSTSYNACCKVLLLVILGLVSQIGGVCSWRVYATELTMQFLFHMYYAVRDPNAAAAINTTSMRGTATAQGKNIPSCRHPK